MRCWQNQRIEAPLSRFIITKGVDIMNRGISRFSPVQPEKFFDGGHIS